MKVKVNLKVKGTIETPRDNMPEGVVNVKPFEATIEEIDVKDITEFVRLCAGELVRLMGEEADR